ncbi:polysaccharide deacetylase [Heyndrickxia sporothermodurans]|nr:polysaccharide deacetylase [Heyndrickxia sporothermodurans]
MNASREGRKTKDRKISTKKLIIGLGISILSLMIIYFFMGILPSTPEKVVAEKSKKQAIVKKKDEMQEYPSKEKSKGKVVFLTFDDGPSELTGKFLDVLKEHNIKATFFMQGSNLQKSNLQKYVKRAISEGHYIGAHSMTHDYSKLYEKKKFVPEMKETLALIHEITGTSPHLVRPPYGSMPGLKNKKIRKQIIKEELKIWDWTIESEDWSLPNNPKQIIKNIKKRTTIDTEVVLMHEKPQTLKVLPKIIAFFQEKGYKFEVYQDDAHFSCNFLNDKNM